MKQKKIWMPAAILTICGLSVMTSCESVDNPVIKPELSEREQFETQLSATFDDVMPYMQLDPTVKAIDIMTSFTNQLNGAALGQQAVSIVVDILGNAYTAKHTCDLWKISELPDEQNVRNAMKGLLGVEDASQILSVNAYNAVGKRHITFVQGQDKATATDADQLIIEYQDLSAGEVTQLRLDLSDASDSIWFFVSDLHSNPLAIKFPSKIELAVATGKAGEVRDVIKGTIRLKSTDGNKWFEPKSMAWQAEVKLEASVNNRTEVLTAAASRDAAGMMNVGCNLAINDRNLLDLSLSGQLEPYTAEELQAYESMTELGSAYKTAYRLLRAINTRSVESVSLTLNEDLTFAGSCNNVAEVIMAIGHCHRLRHEGVTSQQEYEKYVSRLDEAVSFTASQKSTGITAQGAFVTSLIEGYYKPSIALRFQDETEFLAMYDRLSEKDRKQYRALTETFNPIIQSVQKLAETVKQKGQEIKEAYKF